jgi:hypothetical protein
VIDRRKKMANPPPPSNFKKDLSALTLPNGSIIEPGEVFRIAGEHGTRFKFHSLTTNIRTGASWVDCFEVYKARSGVMRSFYIENVVKIPVRRKRRVKRSAASRAS